MIRNAAGLLGVAIMTGGLALAAPAASATPLSNGCPGGAWQLIGVANLSSEGYLVPALVDSPTGGIKSFGNLPGNGDGLVCALPIGRDGPNGKQLYVFEDNNLPI